MPDYMKSTIDGYHLYFTSECIVEAFHAHADKSRSRLSAAKFFIREDGSVVVAKSGRLSPKTIRKIAEFIRLNHSDMFMLWQSRSSNGYYRG